MIPVIAILPKGKDAAGERSNPRVGGTTLPFVSVGVILPKGKD